MTDNEIIKALDHCMNGTNCRCCPYFKRSARCVNDAMGDALNLINRQDSEIERLQTIIDDGAETCDNCHSKYAKKIEQAKAEAIKEFAEQLKKDFCNLEFNADTERKTVRVSELREQMDWVLHTVSIEIIDNLVKEMTEERGNDR